MQNKPIHVLGIDPGYNRLGFAVIQDGKKPVVVSSGCITTTPKTAHADRLLHIGLSLEAVIAAHKIDAVAIETLFFSKNQKTAIKVAEARGVILCACAKAGLPVMEFSPMTIKITVTGYGLSTKSQIMSMIPKIVSLGEKKDMLDDEFDAIAIGLTGVLSYPHIMRSKALLQK